VNGYEKKAKRAVVQSKRSRSGPVARFDSIHLRAQAAVVASARQTDTPMLAM
jgi:hypothetical protein